MMFQEMKNVIEFPIFYHEREVTDQWSDREVALQLCPNTESLCDY